MCKVMIVKALPSRGDGGGGGGGGDRGWSQQRQHAYIVSTLSILVYHINVLIA